MSQGVSGLTKIAIDAVTIGDGASIAAYVVDAAGVLVTSTLVSGKQSLDVNVSQSALPTGAATSALQTSGNASLTSIDAGTPNALGQALMAASMAVTIASDQSALAITAASLPLPAGAATETTLASVLSEIQAITFSEDSAHTSGDLGVMGLAVRNDSGTSLVSADGDYSPLSVDASGALRISGTIALNEAGDYAEDSAHVSGNVGYFNLAVRNDNQATTATSANADYSQFSVDDRGAMYVKDVAAKSNLQQVIAVGVTAVALPTAPLSGRSSMFIQMLSSGQLYLGSATVTSSGATRGLQIGNGGYIAIDVGPGNLVYGIGSSAARDVMVWEFA